MIEDGIVLTRMTMTVVVVVAVVIAVGAGPSTTRIPTIGGVWAVRTTRTIQIGTDVGDDDEVEVEAENGGAVAVAGRGGRRTSNGEGAVCLGPESPRRAACVGTKCNEK